MIEDVSSSNNNNIFYVLLKRLNRLLSIQTELTTENTSEVLDLDINLRAQVHFSQNLSLEKKNLM